MKLETITKVQLSTELGLIDEFGQIKEKNIADLLRTPLRRWGVSPKRAILKSARDQLRAAGIDDVSCVPIVLQRLVTLGECDEVYVGNEIYMAPSEPRWVSVGGGIGAYLGVSDLPVGVSRATPSSNRDIVQRICIESDDDAARLQIAGVREESISEWLAPVDYLRHATRRMRRPVKSDTFNLASFWEMLQTVLAEEGLPLSADAEVRALTGGPGEFFGRYNSTTPEGRWTSVIPDGTWCAYRRGYSETHWHPTIITMYDQEMRSLDLYNHDEWRWALLARGIKLRSAEIFSKDTESLRLTFPPPTQLGTAMELIGASIAPWVWASNTSAPDVWSLIE